MREPMTFVSLKKANGELYLVVWDRESTALVQFWLDRWAANPELSLTPWDAAELGRNARQMMERC